MLNSYKPQIKLDQELLRILTGMANPELGIIAAITSDDLMTKLFRDVVVDPDEIQMRSR